ncbi:Protein phosphatase 1B [Dermatophagoides pteronyssinus]|uniref:Protein phosphatase 1B-like isoform X1 n=2 Tax=Dermatophagoides pteronyssinus TaxID=6956 RepID=A0A6P6YBH6_DERPT|nr:protein phosphatase 1B-like isoform X1 [Dermatophagoides pteronyssinus]KAH9426570.1 Protein phosphatase 1B [Dermatophagoides pteronyssinus]
MGAILDTPHTEKTTDTGTGNDLRYGVCSMQGWRVEMEDAHCAKVGLPGLPEWSFFAVFDGHAGAYVSAHCAENLLSTILQTDSFLDYAAAATSKLQALKTNDNNNTNNTTNNGDVQQTTTTATSPTTSSTTRSSDVGDDDNIENSNNNNKQECDESVTMNSQATTTTTNNNDNNDGSSSNSNQNLERIKSNIREAFLKLDEKMKSLPEVESGEDISGSTAVACLISPTHLFFANCGDSRAVLSRNGQAIFSTQDHKPVNPQEKERIQAAGGSVMIQRVNGSLAVSRALGDYQYKKVVGRGPCEQLVSPEPEITIVERDPSADEFLILACDGIWDVMNNNDLCDFVRHQLRIHSNVEEVCSTIVDTCLHKGSTDNMSVVLVTFPGAPTICEETKRKDEELNEKIKNEVVCQLYRNMELYNSIYLLMQSLKNIKFDNLPPGGGLDSKRTLIEEIQRRQVEKRNNRVNNGQ